MAESSLQMVSRDVVITPEDERGYTRQEEVQARFDEAVRMLRDTDGWTKPRGVKELRADLALEGPAPVRWPHRWWPPSADPVGR